MEPNGDPLLHEQIRCFNILQQRSRPTSKSNLFPTQIVKVHTILDSACSLSICDEKFCLKVKEFLGNRSIIITQTPKSFYRTCPFHIKRSPRQININIIIVFVKRTIVKLLGRTTEI